MRHSDYKFMGLGLPSSRLSYSGPIQQFIPALNPAVIGVFRKVVSWPTTARSFLHWLQGGGGAECE